MNTPVITDAWTRHAFSAMGTVVAVSLPRAEQTSALLSEVEALFGRVERSCTRFDAASDLMRANTDPSGSHAVAPECVAIVVAAQEAHRATNGLFDPRVLDDLVAAGYDRSFEQGSGGTDVRARVRRSRGSWLPTVDVRRGSLSVGDDPIDLGGIGKGWTVDAAADQLRGQVAAFLINAGGDLAVAGDGPTGDGWTVAVEDPRDPTLTLAVLRLRDLHCATSSTGRRRWMNDGRERHHLIDPRTGEPSNGGIASVTVVADTTVRAETWSKALLVAGSRHIADLCGEHKLAAYWVTDDGRTAHSARLAPHLTWERSDD
jgi:thiamine biosynthesis lipoprotein